MQRGVFGKLDDGSIVEQFTLGGPELEVALLAYGATIQSIRVPDAAGQVADVALGFDDITGYVEAHPYFGATIGRFANRIAKGRFVLDGHDYHVPLNDGDNSLHGGTRGFDRHVWEATPVPGAEAVRFRHVSPDGDMGYPGELTTTVTFTVDAADLRIDYEATSDAPTVLNLTNHSYFNLAGEGSGTIEQHELIVAAEQFTGIGAGAIPTGEVLAVDGSPMDFREPRPIGAGLRDGDEQIVHGQGYDHNWVLDGPAHDGVRRAARVVEPHSGRVLEVWTDQPGLQVYTGNQLDATLAGKSGRVYRQGDAVCLETQHFPDSPNQPQFPTTVLRPGETFTSTTIFRFATA
jgi:aldose 1-epimerase